MHKSKIGEKKWKKKIQWKKIHQFPRLKKKSDIAFKTKKHLETAITHKSFVNEKTIGRYVSYERYEFLGDAILEFIVSKYLFVHYKNMPEGELSKLRSSLVCEFTLSKIARDLHFGEFARFSKGERHTGGANRDSILCDLFESVLGAIYLDGGMEPAKDYVKRLLLQDIEHKQRFHDAKSKLQEYAQKQKQDLQYELLAEEGPDHDKKFTVRVMLDGKEMARKTAHSKKTAQQYAAFDALCQLQKNV